jgi:hypothetical protein
LKTPKLGARLREQAKELYDRKLAEGEVNGHDSRMYGGLSNNLRLLLREIATQAVEKGKAKTPSLDQYLASKAVAR